MNKPQTILLLFGGESPEHNVSVRSADNVYHAINKQKYDVKLGYIDHAGKWWLLPEWSDNPVNQDKKALLIAPNENGVQVAGTDELICPDLLFPILHGKNGEDGSVQGLSQLLHVPYIGPSLLGAAATMDKDMTKRLARDAGVPVAPWVLWRTVEQQPDFNNVKSEFGLPVFVKPSRAGSSAGVSKVESEDQWAQALQKAAAFDNEVLIEKAIEGNEFQVAVLGSQNLRVSQICEIQVSTSFHDFEDKYNADSTAQFFVPARLDTGATQRLQDFAKRAYIATAGRGMARVDFFVTPSGDILLNEINSIPGFTARSVYPRLWREQGIPTEELVETLISDALK